jgi:hypothetical protein
MSALCCVSLYVHVDVAQALGVLLYVLCFGRLPFAGDSKLQIINARYDMPRSGQHNRPQQVRERTCRGGRGGLILQVGTLAAQTVPMPLHIPTCHSR